MGLAVCLAHASYTSVVSTCAKSTMGQPGQCRSYSEKLHWRNYLSETPDGTELHEHDVFVLMQIVLERPSVHLHELQRMLAQTTGVFVSEATFCRMLKRFGFFQKKVKYPALQRSDLIRAK